MNVVTKKCYREGCKNLRHDPTNNPYCKGCRSAYQKALRITRGQDPDPRLVDGKPTRGRPKRKLDPLVEEFLAKIKPLEE